MTGKTHLNGGLLLSILLCNNVVDGILTMLGSILPDIDHGGSTLGKTFSFISKLFSHRGFTHSLVFAGLMYLINPWVSYGILMHIFLDMMTNQGVQLFFPIKVKVRFPLAKYVKTNGKFEKLLNFVFPILTLAGLAWRFIL